MRFTVTVTDERMVLAAARSLDALRRAGDSLFSPESWSMVTQGSSGQSGGRCGWVVCTRDHLHYSSTFHGEVSDAEEGMRFVTLLQALAHGDDLERAERTMAAVLHPEGGR